MLLPGSRTDNSRTVIILATLVPIVVLLIAIIALTVTVVLVTRLRRGSETSDDLVEEKTASERRIITQEVNIDSTREKVEAASTLHTAPEDSLSNNFYEKCGPRENIEADDEKILSIEQLISSNRNSLIESYVHLPTEGNLNSSPALVVICETGQESTAAAV